MNHNCDSITTFSMTSKKFCPSESPQPKINFNFFFQSDHKYILESQDSTPQVFRQYLPSSAEETSATVEVEESLSSDDVVEAIVEAVGDRLVQEDLEELVDLVWLQVNSTSPTKTLPEFKVDLHLRFEIGILHLHVLAMDSSVAQLDKYEVDRVKEEEERHCICLE